MVWKTGCRANSYLPNEPVEVEPQSVPVREQKLELELELELALESKLGRQRVAFDWCAATAAVVLYQQADKMNRKFALQFGYLCTCVCVRLCVVYYAALGNYICYPISVKLCLLADERARGA